MAVLLGLGLAALSVDFSLVGLSGASSIVGYWQVGASLITPTVNATETLLANGLVLVAGGEDFVGGVPTTLTTSELYNPATGTWTSTGSLNTPRFNAAAVLLQNGNVLIAGGENVVAGVTTDLATAELYNPSTGLWTATGALPGAIFDETLTLLANGKVLEAGGMDFAAGTQYSDNASALFNPAAGTWVATTTTLTTAESGGTATLLANGNVVVIGGENIVSGVPTALSALQLYNPSTGANGSWSALTPTLPTAEFAATASLLANGQVLYAGGETVASGIVTPLRTAYLFDPSAVTVTATGSLSTARFNSGSTVLSNGDVLAAGGTGATNSGLVTLASAELYDPSQATWTTTGSLAVAQASPAILTLTGGTPVAVGGTSATSGPVSSLETFLSGTTPAITSAGSTTLTAGFAGSFTVTGSGTPTPSLSESGALPPGVSFVDEGNGTAVISGTPAASLSGGYGITITASNSTGTSATQAFVLTVQQAASTTSSTVSTTTTVPSTTTTSAARSVGGYWLARTNGEVFGHGSPAVVEPSPRGAVAAIAATPDGKGYWLVTRDGHVYNIGDALFYGSPFHVKRLTPVAGFAVTPDGKGYWILTSRGVVYSYGDARTLGSIANRRRLLPAVGIAASPDGNGYWIASRNGIVSGFGGVRSYGASPDRRSVVAISASPNGQGYWLITATGNVFNFGEAKFFGSLARRHQIPRIVAMADNPLGTGYFLLSATGFVYPFGDVRTFGSTHVGMSSPFVGIAVTRGS